MVQIIPAILATTEEDFQKDISLYLESQSFEAGWLHIDFMDNIFVPNKSIDASIVDKYPIQLHKEAHLMVAHPMEWIDSLVEAEFERVIFHIEVEDDINKCIDYIKLKGLQVGLAIKTDTPIEKLEPFIESIDVVLVMSIVPGFQGEDFIPETINRVKETSRLRSKSNFSFKIGVDGAIKDTNAKEVADAGADFIIVGSFLLKGDLDENLEKLWEVIEG